jgi:hypothetical protein
MHKKPYYFHGLSDWRSNVGVVNSNLYKDKKIQKQPDKHTVCNKLVQEDREPSEKEMKLQSDLLRRKWN